MRGLSLIIVGTLLAAVGCWICLANGYSATALVLAGAGILIAARGLMGADLNSVDDVMTPIDFVRDPAGAIVDSATDKIIDVFSERMNPEPEPTSTFDADAAIARYLENRPEPVPLASSAPAKGFGRKGL